MSALARTVTVFLRPMEREDVAEIGAIENEAYAFPWSKGIFNDCLRAGHTAWVVEEGGVINAYSIMVVAAGEAHLLNLCVRPRCHGRGFGRVLLAQMIDLARAREAGVMFLEVRPSNARALALYHRAGFAEVGTRPGYYPAHDGKEDALILAMDLSITKPDR
jgi:ribosomal-protein-alanine N-acetyltransferase